MVKVKESLKEKTMKFSFLEKVMLIIGLVIWLPLIIILLLLATALLSVVAIIAIAIAVIGSIIWPVYTFCDYFVFTIASMVGNGKNEQ